MRIIYIDTDFKCHTTNDGTFAAVETNFFDRKSNDYIEGYRFVPSGSTWVREDGEVFHGEMIAPWKDYAELAAAQREYEFELLKAENAEYEAALSEIEAALGVTT